MQMTLWRLYPAQQMGRADTVMQACSQLKKQAEPGWRSSRPLHMRMGSSVMQFCNASDAGTFDANPASSGRSLRCGSKYTF
jgi:hypothetical protein